MNTYLPGIHFLSQLLTTYNYFSEMIIIFKILTFKMFNNNVLGLNPLDSLTLLSIFSS